MTLHEFNAKLAGFHWLRMAASRGRAEIICTILNVNRKKNTKRFTPKTILPIPNPPDNIFFKQLIND